MVFNSEKIVTFYVVLGPALLNTRVFFDDSCCYFDNVIHFYVVPKVRFSKTSCFTCPERLGVSKHVKGVLTVLPRGPVRYGTMAAAAADYFLL